jgi:hypothetical protein
MFLVEIVYKPGEESGLQDNRRRTAVSWYLEARHEAGYIGVDRPFTEHFLLELAGRCCILS